ncbi:hypothetical protein KHDHEBDM_03942 [Pectobacterium polaris]|nr:hypothetical protein KHDHEBDM_03942 [Pectobacterium polaris]
MEPLKHKTHYKQLIRLILSKNKQKEKEYTDDFQLAEKAYILCLLISLETKYLMR